MKKKCYSLILFTGLALFLTLPSIRPNHMKQSSVSSEGSTIRIAETNEIDSYKKRT